ncbi:DUF4377 domain-containing protein [Bacteroides muris (ex Fokt et al. 2023)]|uniref:DUF4377 domain-containing protein n=1 Tax=Bacteroides muris (ex Fokt et al. 2023) TaxID=2937417 RepID=A0A9X2NV99_9BACE|nr:DUF4377 domain-containing protein [Bacteroides muris (ex Fokt et al. 2023)]MCR6506245.1 DUF4377 domain-containing protein [Bacteroides muris (ex Fokt et al. 2023)]
MKSHFLKIQFILLVSLLMCACTDDNEEGKKVTAYSEYTLTVASVKLPGVLTSSGNNVLADVYAVKNEQSTDWEAHGSIGKFEYEEGYEYQILISETSYLDYQMGDPAWTEYELLEVLSKERKNSEELPSHFIPNWYFEQYCAYINPEFAYVIDADKKEDIEKDIKTDATYKFGDSRCYVCNADKWFLLDLDMQTKEYGNVIRKSKEPTDFPKSYKHLYPEQQIVSFGQFDFVTKDAPEEPIMQYDVMISQQFPTKSISRETYILWLYRDLTAYYQSKYPEANVKAVAIRYTTKIGS